MRSKMKMLTSVLCTVALLVSMVTPAFAAKDGALPRKEEATLLDQILERDGFLDGIWYPWLFNGQGGHSLTGNEFMALYHGDEWARPALDEKGADIVYRSIYNLKAMGYNMMAYGGSFWGEGVVYDQNGDVLGIKEDYLVNARRLLDMCREIGMPVMWLVYFHSSDISNYYGIEAWHYITQMYANHTIADHFADRFVRPLCQMLAEYPDVVAMVAITDEPENEINDNDVGDRFDGNRSHYGTTQENVQYFVTAINNAVKEELPDMPRTVAPNTDDLSFYGSLDLDLVGRNRYDSIGLVPDMSNYMTSAPMLLTEYNHPNGGSLADDTYTMVLQTFRKNMMQKGFVGGFQWCHLPDNFDGAHYLQKRNGRSETDYRSTVYDLYYYMTDYRNEHRGVETVLDTPSLFCIDGSGKVEWIPARQATQMDLLRSDDGGNTWIKLLDNVDPARYTDADGKGVYKDTTAPKSGYMYKIVVRDGKGNEVASTPSNKAGADKAHIRELLPVSMPISDLGEDKLPRISRQQAKLLSFGALNNRPMNASDNLLLNCSFEETTGGQWNNNTFLNEYIRVVEDPTAPNGNKSLYFDTSATGEDGWYSFTVDVEPNTDYIFSTWLKGAYIADDNRAKSNLGIIDPEVGMYMVYWDLYSGYARASRRDQQIYPPSWDNEWHLRSVVFNSGEYTQITIALRGYSSKMWVDDMALFRRDQGVKYTSENLGGSVSISMNIEYDSCAPEYSLTENVTMEDRTSTYWLSDSWDNDTLSLVDSNSSHGTVLKYTGVEETRGFYYIKWIDVNPHTDYIFAADIRVLSNGGGRLMLLDDRKAGPRHIMQYDFNTDWFGEDWFHIGLAFDSDAYTRIGITIFDDGGEVLLDNIRLFEAQNGSAYRDEPSGWADDGLGWRYYENHYPAISKWINDGSGWYYLDEEGYMVTNCWKKDSVGWCYLDASGRMATNKWVTDSVGWCYVGGDGYCVTNKWVADSKGWCYLDDQGRMVTNKWIKDSVGWCYVGGDGYCVTNKWVADSKGWCYLDSNGRMVTNKWVQDSKGWCYVGGDGYCVTNQWVKDSKGWCYLDGDGRMVYSRWVDHGGKRYYINASGYMVTGKQTIGGKQYTFDASGALI
ncbi:MAG: hypothetical protein IJC33_04545 [Clostridia bacterium]|nr:hypothetical protein [Clostridia bacterium]